MKRRIIENTRLKKLVKDGDSMVNERDGQDAAQDLYFPIDFVGCCKAMEDVETSHIKVDVSRA